MYPNYGKHDINNFKICEIVRNNNEILDNNMTKAKLQINEIKTR